MFEANNPKNIEVKMSDSALTLFYQPNTTYLKFVSDDFCPYFFHSKTT